MDLILTFLIIIGFLISLVPAAVLDLRSQQITNWIWIPAICVAPLAVFRILMSDTLLLYFLQSLLCVVIVLFLFYFGVLGGADGKALLLVSIIIPWFEISHLFLITAPFLVLFGGYALVGIQSILVLIHNLYYRFVKMRLKLNPEKQRYWIIRWFSFDQTNEEKNSWNPIRVPLLLFFLIAYILLLSIQIVV